MHLYHPKASFGRKPVKAKRKSSVPFLILSVCCCIAVIAVLSLVVVVFKRRSAATVVTDEKVQSQHDSLHAKFEAEAALKEDKVAEHSKETVVVAEEPSHAASPSRASTTVIVGEAVAERVHIPLWDVGPPGAFYTKLQNVCLHSERSSLYNGPLFAYSRNPDRLNSKIPPYFPFGAIAERVASRIGFSFKEVEFETSPIAVPKACHMLGTTLVVENSAGTAGDVNIMSQNALKWFPFVSDHIGTENVARIWATGVGSFPTNDWLHSLAESAIGVPHSGDGQLPPVYANPEITELFQGDHKCEYVCFEESLWMQTAHQWLMSRSHADLVREKAYKYCGVAPEPVLTMAEREAVRQAGGEAPKPLLRILPRFREKVLLNAGEVLTWAQDEGYVPGPLLSNLSDFCAQVQLMAAADVVLSTNGPQMMNLLWMRPNTVFIELRAIGFNWPAFKVLANNVGINFLEWQNDSLERQTDTDPHKTDLMAGPDIKGYLKFAREIIGTAHWESAPCQKQGGYGASVSVNEMLMPFVPCEPPEGYVIRQQDTAPPAEQGQE